MGINFSKMLYYNFNQFYLSKNINSIEVRVQYEIIDYLMGIFFFLMAVHFEIIHDDVALNLS